MISGSLALEQAADDVIGLMQGEVSRPR